MDVDNAKKENLFIDFLLNKIILYTYQIESDNKIQKKGEK